jgi:hypothetical protein
LWIGKFLYNNYRQALETIRNYVPELEAFSTMTGITGDNFESWIQEETAYLKNVTAQAPIVAWKLEYVRTLQSIEALRIKYDGMGSIEFQSYTPSDFVITGAMPAETRQQKKTEAERAKIHAALIEAMVKAAEIEQREGITQRWQPVDREYKDAERFMDRRGFMAVVDDLEGKVVQRLFELSKANLAGTGLIEFIHYHLRSL